MKKISIIASVALLASAMYAKEIVIGAVMPITGPIAAYGQTAWEGVKFANELMPTLKNGDKIKVVLVDTKGDKVETASATTRLIVNDKVTAIIGALTTGNTQQVLQIADEKKTPVIAPAATADKLLDRTKFGARVTFMDSFQGISAANFVTQKLGFKNVVLVTDQAQVYSIGLGKTFEKQLVANGGKIVKKLSITSGDKDFKAVVSQIASLNPEAVYLPIYHPEAAMIARQAKQVGLKAVLISGDGVGNDDFLKLAGDAANGYLYTDTFDQTKPPTKMSEKFVSEFKKQNPNTDIAGFTALGADAYLVMIDAMNRCEDPTDKVCVNEKIHETTNFEGVSGVISIDKKGNATRSVVIKEVKDEKATFRDIVNP